MSGVKTWSPFYSDWRRAELCISNQRVIFPKKKKKKGFQKKKKTQYTQTHTHMHTRTHIHDLCLFFSKSEPDRIQNKESMGSCFWCATCWGSESTLGRHLVLFQDADSCKQQALANSGNSGGQLGGWTFLDIHTHTEQKNILKKSLLWNTSWQHCQDKH